ncbi:MAG: bifunctional adenosylcobinamide kinase/adenosylcobinamide-phosphate guanylyltransferase [Gammaproteobacteria bacterium]|nr:bifunctional adenosylcobinamide kinase/adenosylcobinamide-phosphate guanylyltransferase [Gammaproteobacteria bacterium]MCY4219431.1 bifunctional adenosylcobinamide kinase/adenosylcobinamide-phosphate guanylyltransferase [Gammaproteobacteria bacterium]MCY4275181.1 bifunctional adenosylcobinamide kinase/adenosylcobinamide-phosphate guanylyltransferase [Gammaproteobacteria bacterium]
MIELIVGGARSGKSRYAEDCALKSSDSPIYIATAEPRDQEMADRIQEHQRRRGKQWRLIEEPFNLSTILSNISCDDSAVVDCLTLWLSNWLCLKDRQGWIDERQRFLSGLTRIQSSIWFVSNETGMGVIPTNPLSREFVDESGKLHQDIAQRVDLVTHMFCGIPTRIK